jgi:P4 family phage/plasmid primase-like protien
VNTSNETPAAQVRAANADPASADQIVLWGVNDDASCRCPKGLDCPVKNRGKHPKCAPFEPGDNLGNLTGAKHGRIVVDVDVRDGDGYAQLESMPGFQESTTLTIATASGGAHFYYRHPGIHVGNGKLATHIDVRGDADGWAYVVAPGSRVVCEDGSVATHEVYVDAPLADAPDWLLAQLLQRGSSAKASEPVTPIDEAHPDWSYRVERFTDACTRAAPACEDGTSSRKLFALACRAMLDLRLPLETARDILLNHWSSRCTRADGVTPYPYEPDEVERALENATLVAGGESREIFSRATTEGFAALVAARSKAAPAEPSVAIKALAARVATRPEPYLPPALTDTGNAELFAQLHGENVRFVPAWKSWLVWDGQRWRRDDLETVGTLAKDVARTRWEYVAKYGTDADDKMKLSKWANASESKRGRENTIALTQLEPGVPVSHEALDANAWLLNVANGTVDLRTGELRDHARGDHMTKLAPVAFDADAACPTWDRFLARVTGASSELAEFLARAVGYSLTGDVGEQVLFFLQGPGANGKSVFTLIVRELIGDYAKQAAPDLLLAKHGESHPTEIADLHGARFALCQEVDQGRRWAEATLKQLTGGDRVKARRMREDFWEFEPTHKLWVCANHKPQVRGADEGIWRRIKLVPFEVTIPPAERDPKLVEKLRAELPGILAWAVRGCLAWQRDGLGVPKQIADATEAYRKEEDRVGAFIDECCEEGGAFDVSKKDIFAAYQRWALASGEEAVTKREFGDRVASRGGVIDGKTGKKGHIWKGLRLRGSATHAASVATC